MNRECGRQGRLQALLNWALPAAEVQFLLRLGLLGFAGLFGLGLGLVMASGGADFTMPNLEASVAPPCEGEAKEQASVTVPPVGKPDAAPLAFVPGCPAAKKVRNPNVGWSLVATLGCEGDEPCADVPFPPDETMLIEGVSASSRTHGVFAVWTKRHVYASFDDGRTFARVLEGRSGDGDVTSVVVDCRGVVRALRGEARLGTADGFQESWQTLRFAIHNNGDEAGRQRVSLAAGAGWIVYAGHDAVSDGLVAISDDGARTWRFLAVPNGQRWALHNTASMFDNGNLHLASSLGYRCGAHTTMSTWHIPSRTRRFASKDDVDFEPTPTPDGWAYAVCEDGDTLCAARLGAPMVRSSPRLSVSSDFLVISNGRQSLLRTADSLIRVRGRHAELVTTVPIPVERLALDSSGRAVGFMGRHIVRWSARRGWRRLWSLPMQAVAHDDE